MIIDHPNGLKEVCGQCKPYSTDGPVCDYFTSLAGDLDKYSKETASILDPVWEREFAPEKKEKTLT